MREAEKEAFTPTHDKKIETKRENVEENFLASRIIEVHETKLMKLNNKIIVKENLIEIELNLESS